MQFGMRRLSFFTEGVEGDKDYPELLWKPKVVKAKIDPCSVENIYNMNEIGLFCRKISNYTLLTPNNNISAARGKKV